MLSAENLNFCEFCEKDERFPRVAFVDFPNNSLHVHKKRTNSLNVHEKHTLSEKTGCTCCEFCEKYARFPRVEFVDFPKHSLNFNEKTHNFTKSSRKTHIFIKRMSFWELCEKDARFPRVEFVDVRKIATAPKENQKIDSGVVQEDQPP